MSSILPITLTGDTLGKRHKQINTLVNETYKRNENFKNLQNAPEKSVIDRLFKIDLASKHRDVEYITQNLKDADMLYVSRALKAIWLLESKYQDIINPEYLENNLYPYMITTAVTKMKHWIHLHLKDEPRSEKFYDFYKETELELAIKFLVKSSSDFIMKEFPKILDVVSPKYYKLLCERNAQVAKLFYDSVESDEKQKSRYLKNEKDFHLSMKCMLKSDPNLYLDITEKYFNVHKFQRFSSIATKFIINYHKDRVLKKPELYISRILDLTTMAESLEEEEVKNLIIQLAKAKYISYWFNYKNVEPLIKKLKPENRAAFKKKVFVDKDVGNEVEEWPYKESSAPEMKDLGPDIFKDREHDPHEYERYGLDGFNKRKIMKKCARWHGDMGMAYCMAESCIAKVKTELDKLFDEFRFVGFEKTFYELSKRILAESSSQNRQYIMLVLVSKSGGRPEAVATLMGLLVKHSNEPSNLRAAIIRSLVNRAFVWRLPQETWKELMAFGKGLGLDGTPPEAECIEGLHAVFIRMLLNGKVDANILKAFLEQFSDLSSYKLTAVEKKCVSEVLPKLLLSAAKEKVDVKDAIDLIRKLIEVLRVYHLKVDTYPGLIPTIIDLATKDFSSCVPLLESLFKSKIGRKDLFKFTYKLIKTDASHLNALKHDTSVLDFEVFYESCLDSRKFEKFLRKITIYFNENSDLVFQYRNKLKVKEHNKLISRPLAMLLGVEFLSYMQDVDKEDKIESKIFAAVLRANAHLARPFIDIDSLGWQKAGAKMIANKLTICPLVDVESNIQKLLKSKRTAKLALLLSKRNKIFTDVFVKTAELRPSMAIKSGFKRMQEQGDKVDPIIWLTIKPLIDQINFDKDTKTVYIKKLISHANAVPLKIRPEYCVTLFKAFDKLNSFERYVRMQWLCRIENLLFDVDELFIEEIIKKFLEELNPEKLTENYDECADNSLFIRVILTYIYLSKSEETFNRKFETFGTKLFAKMTEIFKIPEKTEIFFKFLDEILLNFKNTKVFMSPEYVSCLFLMEKTVNWMQTILPIDQHFKKYVNIHLTMLYYKTIRQTVIEAPEVFETETRKCKEAVTMVGNLFGKHIAKDVKELVAKYFESIIYLYKDTLVQYLDEYFNYTQSSDFLSAVVKGILEKDPDVARLGMSVLKDKYYIIGEEKSAEISKSFKELDDLKNKFFVYAELLS